MDGNFNNDDGVDEPVRRVRLDQRRQRNFHYDTRNLTRLLASEADLVLTDLGSNLDPLREVLDRQGARPDLLVVLLSVLAKAASTQMSHNTLNKVLVVVVESRFLLTGVPDLLQQALRKAITQEVESRGILKNMVALLTEIVTRLPQSSLGVVGAVDFVRVVVDQLRARTQAVDEELLLDLKNLEHLKDSTLQRLQNPDTRTTPERGEAGERPPPNDFREIDITPSVDDIFPPEEVYLRKNKDRGGYDDLDHYLDVQFRLLREDFICPLRDGIQEYMETRSQRRFQDIRLYDNVKIVRTVCSHTALHHRLAFDVTKFKGIRWENTKRLIYGALVCLSTDNFKTFLVATVSDRDPKNLKMGLVDVQFAHSLRELARIPTETSFVMVETTAYFESYRHVLKGLQNIDDLPFDQYIVHCEHEVEPPAYLRNGTTRFDLRPLVDEDSVVKEDTLGRGDNRILTQTFSRESAPAERVKILDEDRWPRGKLLHLDDSQFKALKTALTREFAIIQGPPGTGKTYVGLKIAKALLQNLEAWSPRGDSRPMLIVCYTNHALDQFVEGIVKFFKGSVVRVGSKCQSELLKQFSLQNLRRQISRTVEGQEFRRINSLRWTAREEMAALKVKIERAGSKLDATGRAVLCDNVLRPYMSATHQRDLEETFQMLQFQLGQQGMKTNKSGALVEWLGLGVIGTVEVEVEPAQAAEEAEEEEEETIDVEEEGIAIQRQRKLEDIDDFDDDLDDTVLHQLEREFRSLQLEKDVDVAYDAFAAPQHPEEEQRGQGQGFVPEIFVQQRKARRRQQRKVQHELRSSDRMTEEQAKAARDLWRLPNAQRWRLYRYWVAKHCQTLREDVAELEEKYHTCAEQLRDVLMMQDKRVFRNMTVIAMTTTAAARYQSVLQEVQPRVILVEEAAEVLEGHVITTLSQGCEHLVLIGDHKQLRPNPTVFRLATRYNLALSLFERMINNGVKCDTLALQHRMRPEISRLVKPIYPNLQDHEVVRGYPHVKGVACDVFFLSHSQPERHDNEIKSHSNEYEANMVVRLCDYLLKQGYEPTQITVLTTYSGQLFKLKKLMPRSRYQGVRVTAVDNFQGEENDIILLSLVRSNDDGKIGFLKTENRVCVALSRAKVGLYVLGNLELLASQSHLWREISIDLKQRQATGPRLLLRCQNHPRDPGTAVQFPLDFQQCPEGGCSKPCGTRLDCGHTCVMPCHPYDADHKQYKCTKKCARTLCEREHPCPLQCFQKCAPCRVKVEKVIPRCGHRQRVPCSVEAEKFVCEEDCPEVLGCGHRCGNMCRDRFHSCSTLVTKTWRCGHKGDVLCARKDQQECLAPCGRTLQCEHQCSGRCDRCFEGRLHEGCKMKCKKILVCGHDCQSTCNMCPPCNRACENRCPHSTCGKRCGDPCVPCAEPCTWRCRHLRCTRLCGEICNREPCNVPCPRVLNCGHPCIGLCGEPCPKLCRVCDQEEVTTILFGDEDEEDARFVELEDCGHVIEVTALDRYMQMRDESESTFVGLKQCPKCKTYIRRNMRYGAIIRQALKDIEEVKKRNHGGRGEVSRLRLQLDLEVSLQRDPDLREDFDDVLTRIANDTATDLATVKTQFQLLEDLHKVIKEFKEASTKERTSLRGKDLDGPMRELQEVRKWLKSSRRVIGQQVVDDAQNETQRYRDLLRFKLMRWRVQDRDVTLPQPLPGRFRQAEAFFADGKPHSKDRQDFCRDVYGQLTKVVPASGLGVSEEERKQIVAAVGLGQGHWYKCRRGHIYAIGDCGGANQGGRCPECGDAIGGQSHALAPGNEHAPEMDGSRFPAWSNEANLEGFNPNYLPPGF